MTEQENGYYRINTAKTWLAPNAFSIGNLYPKEQCQFAVIAKRICRFCDTFDATRIAIEARSRMMPILLRASP